MLGASLCWLLKLPSKHQPKCTLKSGEVCDSNSEQRHLAGEVLCVTFSLGFGEGDGCTQRALWSGQYLGPAKSLAGTACRGKQGSVQVKRLQKGIEIKKLLNGWRVNKNTLLK